MVRQGIRARRRNAIEVAAQPTRSAKGDSTCRTGRCIGRGNGVLVLLCALACATSQAEDAWVLHPAVQLMGSYDDNIDLAPSGARSERGLRLATALGITRNRAQSTLSATAGLDVIEYSASDATRESGNYFFQLTGTNEAPRDNWQLDASYMNDTLQRTIELAPDPADEPDSDIDVALVTRPVERERVSVKPAWTHNLSPRSRLRLAYVLSTQRFDEPAGIELVDYDRHVLSTRFIHRYSRRDSINMDVRVQRFEPEGLRAVDTYEVATGYSHSYSPVGSVALEAGIRRVSGAGDEAGLVAGLSWRGKTERANTMLSVRRQVFPNGLGDLVESDQVVAKWNRQVGPRTALLTSARAFDTAPLDRLRNTGRQYVEVNAELRHALDRQWSLGAEYRLRWIDRESDPDSATSNALYVFVGFGQPVTLD